MQTVIVAYQQGIWPVVCILQFCVSFSFTFLRSVCKNDNDGCASLHLQIEKCQRFCDSRCTFKWQREGERERVKEKKRKIEREENRVEKKLERGKEI